MDIVTNHTAKLLSYKTKFVNSSYVLLKKNQYGEDICCQVNKLFLASQLINRLDCYCFPSGPINSKFIITVDDYSITPNTIYTIKINGSVVGTRNSNLSPTSYAMYNALFSNVAGLLYDVEFIFTSYTINDAVFIKRSYRYTVYAGCDVTSIEVLHGVTTDTLITTVIGDCTEVICHNCTSDSDLPKLYEVLDNLLK